METDTKRILIAGQFPPPVHGFSYITQQMEKLLSKQYDTKIIDLVPHTKRGSVVYHLRRLWLVVKGCVAIANYALRARNFKKIYIGCESRMGLIYTILISLTARISGLSIYIHYHNFNFIDNYSLLMDLFLKILSKNTVHIFLCPLMGKQLAERYKKELKSIVISNSAFVADSGTTVKTLKPSETITIGLLSNLNEEKGLSIFLDTLRKAIQNELNVKAVLAGPPVSDKDHKTIEQAKSEFGDKLDYRGAVYNEEKTQFFRDIDVFLFPTCYANEAQPTVIAESLSFGVPVLSYQRGCIRDQVGSCGDVFDNAEDFAAKALSRLKEMINDVDSLNDLKQASQKAFIRDKSKALETAKNIFSTKLTVFGS